MAFAVNSCYVKCALLQNAVFVIRDWQDEIEDGMEGGKKYLEYELSNGKFSEQHQATVDAIKNAFQELQCCLLPDPGKIVKKKNKFEVKGTKKLLLCGVYCRLFGVFNCACACF